MNKLLMLYLIEMLIVCDGYKIGTEIDEDDELLLNPVNENTKTNYKKVIINSTIASICVLGLILIGYMCFGG